MSAQPKLLEQTRINLQLRPAQSLDMIKIFTGQRTDFPFSQPLTLTKQSILSWLDGLKAVDEYNSAKYDKIKSVTEPFFKKTHYYEKFIKFAKENGVTVDRHDFEPDGYSTTFHIHDVAALLLKYRQDLFKKYSQKLETVYKLLKKGKPDFTIPTRSISRLNGLSYKNIKHTQFPEQIRSLPTLPSIEPESFLNDDIKSEWNLDNFSTTSEPKLGGKKRTRTSKRRQRRKSTTSTTRHQRRTWRKRTVRRRKSIRRTKHYK